jgi:hypothetical protein
MRQSSCRTPSGMSTTPTLWPSVTITSAVRRMSSVTGRSNSSLGSRPSSAIAVRTCGSISARVAVPAE